MRVRTGRAKNLEVEKMLRLRQWRWTWEYLHTDWWTGAFEKIDYGSCGILCARLMIGD